MCQIVGLDCVFVMFYFQIDVDYQMIVFYIGVGGGFVIVGCVLVVFGQYYVVKVDGQFVVICLCVGFVDGYDDVVLIGIFVSDGGFDQW